MWQFQIPVWICHLEINILADGSCVGGNDWNSLQEGVDTCPMAPILPLNSPISLVDMPPLTFLHFTQICASDFLPFSTIDDV